MADPISPAEASDMAATTIADLQDLAALDGQDIAVSTAVALMYGAAGFLAQTVGPTRLLDSLRALLAECQIQADFQNFGSHEEVRH